MFEEFYEMYEPEEQEVIALINRCIGGGYNWKGRKRSASMSPFLMASIMGGTFE